MLNLNRCPVRASALLCPSWRPKPENRSIIGVIPSFHSRANYRSWRSLWSPHVAEPCMEPFISVSATVFTFLTCNRRCCCWHASAMRDTVAKGGRVLFVGTKRVLQIKLPKPHAIAVSTGTPSLVMDVYKLGWATVSQSIRRLRELEARLEAKRRSAGQERNSY